MLTRMGMTSGISSGVRGLVPKSTGGYMALGATAGLTGAGIGSVIRHRKMDKMNNGRGPSASQYSDITKNRGLISNPFSV
jgi:hypothetical protein